jgi:hypothetical protein
MGPQRLARGSIRLFLSSSYKMEAKNTSVNIFNIQQKVFLWKNGVTV